MIKIKKVTKTIEEEEIEDIICNKCGRSLKGKYDYSGINELRVEGGYDSPVFNDGDKYIFSLCEYCLKELFESFEIEVEHK
jgi:hypothetical protein